MMFLRILMILALAAFSFSAPAFAEDAGPQVKIEKRQLLVPRKGEGAEATGFFEDPRQWLRETERRFTGAVKTSLQEVKSTGSIWAAWSILLIGFAYGVLHAAGPGHGKAVISAWLLATESELKRGILIAFLSSAVQAITAVAIVGAALMLFSASLSAARNAAGLLESISYAGIALMGLYLVWSAFRPHGHTHAHAKASHHDHDHHGHDHHGHDHHDHANCGHAHAPEAKDVRGDWSLARAATMSLAIGIRPCTGAILILLASWPLGLFWAGVASTFAMAAGTFLTVSVIAGLTVYSKQLAIRLAGTERPWLKWAEFAARLAAGLLVTGLGAILFWASLGNGFAPG